MSFYLFSLILIHFRFNNTYFNCFILGKTYLNGIETSINNVEIAHRQRLINNHQKLLEKNTNMVVKTAISDMNNNNNNNNKQLNQVEFIEHPQDSLITGKLPVLVQCAIKNAGLSFIECNNKARDDVKRNITWKENIKYETLTVFLKKKDFESKSSNSVLRRLVCRCIAYSSDNIEKFHSSKAIIKNSCNYLFFYHCCLNQF